MNTKERILDEALTLFAQKGYGNVFVGDIADAVGIKAPSLYKHYRSKLDIFNAILDEMKKRFEKQTAALSFHGNDVNLDADIFRSITEEGLVDSGKKLFLYFLHDSYECRFRKMLTIEQFQNADLSELYTKQYVDGPLSYQSAMLGMLESAGILRNDDRDVMALQFYAPLYLLLTVCDRDPEREPEMMILLEKHIRLFSRLYKQEEEQE